jgi:hypothetical protein
VLDLLTVSVSATDEASGVSDTESTQVLVWRWWLLLIPVLLLLAALGWWLWRRRRATDPGGRQDASGDPVAAESPVAAP